MEKFNCMFPLSYTASCCSKLYHTVSMCRHTCMCGVYVLVCAQACTQEPEENVRHPALSFILFPWDKVFPWTWRSVFLFFVVWALQQVPAMLLFPHTPPPSPRVTSADVHTQLLMRVQEIWTRVLGLANKRSDPLVEPPFQPHTHAPF